MHNALLAAVNISKQYTSGTGVVRVLHEVSMAIHSGETIAITGASGCGKSTLLHCLALLDSPTSGEINVQGQPTHTMSDDKKAGLRNSLFGFVYQHHHLMRDFTALENIQMPALIAGKKSSERAQQLLAQVGLTHRSNHYAGELSGGEQQRVAIARALINKPQILLADEPTGNLDPATAGIVSDLLFDVVKKENLALILVTHNMELAARCGTHFTLKNGVLEQI